MSGIALFTPNEIMLHQAESILAKEGNSHVLIRKCIRTEDAVSEAKNAIAEGINIIIARGRQAMEIRSHTNVMVTEIVMTAQELGLLIMRAKSIIRKPHLKVALFGWGDMFCDTSYFDQLYDISLKRYSLKESEEWRNVILKSAEDHPDVIIGGNAAVDGAAELGIPAIYLTGTGESVATAIQSAESLYRMAEIEKQNYAQFYTVLDSSTNGIVKIGMNGKILIVNRSMEGIVHMDSQELIGTDIERLFPDIGIGKISDILNGKSGNYTTFLSYREQELVLVAEPISVEGTITGAILSFNRIRHMNATDNDTLEKQYLNGYMAHMTFDGIEKDLKGLRPITEKAKLYALSSSPILIESLSGPELDAMAQSIHNYGMRKNGPFIMLNLAGMSDEQQSRALFGDVKEKEPGAILNADRGTLVIQSIDKLSLTLQYILIRAIRTHRIRIGQKPADTRSFDTRIIACTAKNLTELRRENRIRSDLYYTLKSLRIRIPNLRDRPKDVEYLLNAYVRQYIQQYSRFHVLTPGAWKVLREYQWEGNSIQLQSFCERMILTAGSRSITEDYVKALLEELYRNDSKVNDFNTAVKAPEQEPEKTPEDPRYELLRRTLKKYGGNRKLSARELKISTTTLWRKIIQYGLEGEGK